MAVVILHVTLVGHGPPEEGATRGAGLARRLASLKKLTIFIASGVSPVHQFESFLVVLDEEMTWKHIWKEMFNLKSLTFLTSIIIRQI